MGRALQMLMQKSAAVAGALSIGLASCASPPTRVSGVAGQPVARDPYAHRQIYEDDRRVALPAVPTSAHQCDAWFNQVMALERANIDPGKPRVGEFYRPELMAIGDSLFNGVQSLRINWFLSEWSAPALVAIRLGLIQERDADRTGQRLFYSPQYPTFGEDVVATRNYGFNLEALPDTIIGTSRAVREQAQLLSALATTDRPPNGRPFVDNLSYLGADSYDLLYWTPADYRQRALSTTRRLRLGLLGATSLSDALYFANAAYVLNPTRNPCLEHMTPIDQVALRHPRRVIIDIGANDGMYGMAFGHNTPQTPACSQGDAKDRGERGFARCSSDMIDAALSVDYVRNVTEMLRRLSEIEGLGDVYLNSLPEPSRTANLVPFERGGHWYWYNDLMSSPGSGADDLNGKIRFTDQEVQTSDGLIRQVNRQIADVIAAANRRGPTRFHMVDVDARLADLDAKRCDLETPAGVPREACRRSHGLFLSQERFKGGYDVTLDNRPIRFEGNTGPRTGSGFRTKIVEGGLFSFDNMHLSSVGYEVMADRIIGAMLASRDAGVLPGRIDGRDTCPGTPVAGLPPPPYGACAALLVTPGWSYEDATRRQWSFLRVAGLDETNDRKKLSGRINFLLRLFHVYSNDSAKRGLAPDGG